MTLLGKVAPANFVPAAAVIQRERALFIRTGRKASLGCLESVNIEIPKRNVGTYVNTAFLELYGS
jgi:hypothetical protein